MKICGSQINCIDVLVVGAGPIGLINSLWFAKRGKKVICIEQYSEVRNDYRKTFNERHQQIGLDVDSLNFLKEVDIVICGEIYKMGSPDHDWINIPIYLLQNVLYKESKTYDNLHFLFETTIESVTSISPNQTCRVILNTNNDYVYALAPKFVIIADGKQGRGTAERFFNFPMPSKVHLSTYGLVGMMERNIETRSSICLQNYSSDDYCSQIYPEFKNLYIRLLGNMRERYIALGLGDINGTNRFLELTALEIKNLLIEAYNLYRDKTMGEPEIIDLDNYSQTPIPINLDYRKETIKLFEGSSTIITVEGDAARKTTFFSGSGLNTGFRACKQLFKFSNDNDHIIFAETTNSNCLIILDQKLLEKDQICLNISYDLLVRGLHYIHRDSSVELSVSDDQPLISSIYPLEVEPGWFIHIHGKNLIRKNLIHKNTMKLNCIFEWDKGAMKTQNIIIYSTSQIGVKIPKNAFGHVKLSLEFEDNIIVHSPVLIQSSKITDIADIHNIYLEDDWIYIEGKNFACPCSVIIRSLNYENKIKAYCTSSNSLVISSTLPINQSLTFIVETPLGTSKEFIQSFSLPL